jgi:tripartite-type tricarboxylate transporter receptor subunit TctC
MPKITLLPMSRRALMGAAAALPFAARAQAAWKPSRPVTLIVPFAAGSGTDSVSRLLASLLEQEWGSQVVVDNRPGANGAIAAVATARTAPDGHTVMITTNSPHGATPALMKRPTYDAINDFTPIGRMGTYIFVLAVNDQVPARNLQEFLALARSQPGKLTYASGNTTGVVGGAMLTSLGNIQMEHVPYRSTPPAMTDVISGRVTGIIVDVAASRGFLQEGKLRSLGITSATRTPLLPNEPTLAEAGLPGFELLSWMGAVGPARMPAEVVTAWNAALRKVWERPETADRLASFGIERVTSTPEEFGAFIRSQIETWARQIKAAGIEPE